MIQSDSTQPDVKYTLIGNTTFVARVFTNLDARTRRE